MGNEKVSVLIPLYNMRDWIGPAIESVLAQTRKVDEIIVRDDGSTDGGAEEAAMLVDKAAALGVSLIIIVDAVNRGGGFRFRQMIAEATGDFIVPFAADDLLEPQFVERMLAELKAHPEALMAACHPSFMDKQGNPVSDPKLDVRLQIPKPKALPRAELLADLKRGNKYFGAGMYRASTFVKVGLFDNDLKWLSDWDYYLRVLKVGDLLVVEEPLCRYRLHEKALSLITADKFQDQWRMFRQIREKHFAPTVRKVCIATPFYMNLCFSNYKSSLIGAIDWLTKRGIAWEVMDLNGDSYVDRAKNTIATKFLESDCTDLMMIDSDMSFGPQAIERILSWDQEIVAGAFPMKNSWDQFVGNPIFDENKHFVGHSLSDGSYLLKALRVAGGFLRIKRSALIKFADKYPERIYLDQSADPGARHRIYIDFFECARRGYTRYGEDMYFSQLCNEAGIEMFIDTNITFGHYGIKCWEGNFHEALQADTVKANAEAAAAAQAKVVTEIASARAAATGETGGAPIEVKEAPAAAEATS